MNEARNYFCSIINIRAVLIHIKAKKGTLSINSKLEKELIK